MQRLAAQLERETKERENLQKLHEQVKENQAALRERLLLKATVGAVSPSEVIEQGQALGLDLLARYYQVLIIRTELADRSDHFDYGEYQQFQQVVADLVENNPDIYLLRKGWEKLVLIIKGNDLELLDEERGLNTRKDRPGIKENQVSTHYRRRRPQKKDRRHLPILY